MILRETGLAGAYLIEPQSHCDGRGHFTRTFCAETFRAHAMNPHLEQISSSYNVSCGIVRGLHLQRPPHAEAKLVRVTAGAIYDVIVDLRAASPTYGQWRGFELRADDRRQLYIPEGFAHGFQTLAEGTEVTYHISTAYVPEAADGICWDDADLKIAWPDPANATLSERDRSLGRLADFAPISLPC